jgi:trans-aconitate methyltransferase
MDRWRSCGWFGLVCRQLAKRGCSVTGLDPSAEMMEGAKALDEKEGVRVTYVQGKTEDTQLPTASFEMVTAGTCWHWFDSHKAFAVRTVHSRVEWSPPLASLCSTRPRAPGSGAAAGGGRASRHLPL